MKNFNAIIQVAEDAEFRRTVLDAIERQTDATLKAYVVATLADKVRDIIQRQDMQALIRATIQEATKQYMNLYFAGNLFANKEIGDANTLAKSMILERFTEERMAEIMTDAVERVVRSRLKTL